MRESRARRDRPTRRPRALARWLALLLATGCGEPAPAPLSVSGDWPVVVELPQRSEPRYPRVVLFTFDTLRADHVSAHGYQRRTTPFFDTLASQGALFTRASATISQTAPSHSSMLTGLPPIVHGVLQNGHQLDRDAVDLARVFGAAGFETTACVNTGFLRGVAHSFQNVRASTERGKDVVELATRWLTKERKNERFFLWVHVFDPHRWKTLAEMVDSERMFRGKTPPDFEPYLMELHGLDRLAADGGPPVLRREESEQVVFQSREEYLRYVEAYDALTLLADQNLRTLYKAIEALALPGPTLWIVTADHGEGLASHGLCGHGGHIYEEQLSVPLLLHASDKSLARRRIDALATHLDLYPTLLETLGGRAQAPEGLLEGRSLWPLVRGEAVDWSERAVFAQRTPSGDGLYSLRTERYKLLDGRGSADDQDELYDLSSDPRELENRVGELSAERDALTRELEQRLRVFETHAQSAEQAVPEEWMNELRDLGYVR